MIRNLKVLGLALMAVFAMSAVAASAASAQTTDGKLTSDGPFYLLGEDETVETEGNHLTYFKENGEAGDHVTCPDSTYTGEKVGTSEPLTSGTSTITVTPTYKNCVTNGSVFTTVTMNGCDFVFHIGETVVPNERYTVTADLICPAEKVVVVEVYSGSGEALKLCTVTFGEQEGLHGTPEKPVTIREVSTNLLRVTGTFAGITATKEGLCGHEHTKTAEYNVDVTLWGVDSDEIEETHVSLSH